jgi:hypothetical protein
MTAGIGVARLPEANILKPTRYSSRRYSFGHSTPAGTKAGTP